MSTSSGNRHDTPPLKWGDLIDGERVKYLRGLQDNSTRKDAPFASVRLTGADVYWLAKYTLATGATMALAEQRLEEAKKNPLLRSSLDFSAVNLRRAILAGAQLEGAILGKAQLDGIIAGYINLKGAYLSEATLVGAFLDRAMLDGAVLRAAKLQDSSLWGASLNETLLDEAHLEHAILRHTTLEHANLQGASAVGADFSDAALKRAYLADATLNHATFYEAHLEQAVFSKADLTYADLRRARFDEATRFNEAHLNQAAIDQANLNDVNLAVVDWHTVKKLDDETRPTPADADPRAAKASGKGIVGAYQRSREEYKRRQELYGNAARAYRSLSVALRDQGLATEATRYHYRAEVMQRRYRFNNARYLLRTRHFLQSPWLFVLWALSLALGVFAGYGVYHLWRLLVTYVTVILVFAGVFYLFGQEPHQSLTVIDALTLSLTSFHGRGLQPSDTLSAALRFYAGIEAIFGLLIEGLFIAAFTRRVTGL
ncbi:MAG: pentapeptide repeat-containing protein [Ktedonobacterales bacterium]